MQCWRLGARLWRKAAERGFGVTAQILGHNYQSGWEVPQDYVKAARWWRKAAEQGYIDAQYNLGVSSLSFPSTGPSHVLRGYQGL